MFKDKRHAVWPKRPLVSSMLAVLCLLVLGLVTLDLFAAEETDMKRIGGWAWNPIIGWVSQQSSIQDKETSDKTGEFGVLEDTATGDLSGWSWSGNAGWICWGETCKDPTLAPYQATYGSGKPPITAPGHEKAWAVKNSDNTVDGWAQLLSYRGYGWVCLSQKTCGSQNGWGVRYDSAKNEFTGWAWAGGKIGWLVFSGKTLYDTKIKPPCPRGTIICAGTDTNNIQYTTCKASCAITETVQSCAGANSCKTGLMCNVAENRCVESDTDTDKGEGYIGRACDPYCEKAVNVDDDEKSTQWKTQYLGTWLNVVGGNIASSIGSITGSGTLPLGQKNAEFLIISGRSPTDGKEKAISQFSSLCEKALGAKSCANFGLSSGTVRGKKEGALETPLAKRVTITVKRGDQTTNRVRLKSKGASVDVDALTELPSTGKEKNKYGKRVSSVAAEAALLNAFHESSATPGIYVVDGDLTLDQAGSDRGPWYLWNGSDATKSAARTVVVKGTLTIKQNLVYDSTGVGVGIKHPRQLASVAWIVLKKDDRSGGDIIIDACVPPSTSERGSRSLLAEVSGIFFAEGQVKTGSGKGADCKSNLGYRDDSDGNSVPNVTPATNLWGRAEALLFTDSATHPDALKKNAARIAALRGGFADIPLVVHGAMIAKKFIFERAYIGPESASEQIINDGRSFVNTPPGLEEMFGAFPAF